MGFLLFHLLKINPHSSWPLSTTIFSLGWSLCLSVLPSPLTVIFASSFSAILLFFHLPAIVLSSHFLKKNTVKNNFALQHATSVIEKKRVEMRSLKKATVAWLHLALISDTRRSTTDIKNGIWGTTLKPRYSTALIYLSISDTQTSAPRSKANQTRDWK